MTMLCFGSRVKKEKKIIRLTIKIMFANVTVCYNHKMFIDTPVSNHSVDMTN